MAIQGYIKLHRQIENNWLWTSEPFTKGQAWVDLLLIANHKDNSFFIRGIKIELKRGQIARKEEGLAERWKWSKGKVRRFIKILKTEQQIEQQTSNKINILTIINYDFYQKTEQQMKLQIGLQKEDFDKVYCLYNNMNGDVDILLYENMKEPFSNCIKALGGIERVINQIKLYLQCIKAGRSKKDFKNWINEPESYAENWEAILKEMKSQNKSEKYSDEIPIAESNEKEKLEYMPELSSQEFWKNFIKEIKQVFDKVDKNIYIRWLSKMKPFHKNDKEILLSAPSKFLRDWIKREYLDDIKTIYQKINKNQDLQVIIISSTNEEQGNLTLSSNKNGYL